jgi:hypothetical protein
MAKTTEKLMIKGTEESVTRKSLEENGITTSIEVKKVENGYVVTVRQDGYKKDKWINSEKVYISKTDPLEEPGEVEKKESFKESLNNALNNLKL